MNEVTYWQKSGRIYVKEGDKDVLLATGYSGHPPYVNEPSAEALKAAGPIPRGVYRGVRIGDHVRLGPQVLALIPEPKQELHGRSGFMIHGDNSYGNRSASHGCIVVHLKARNRLAELAPFRLTVR